MLLRQQLNRYISEQPEFLHSFSPVRLLPSALAPHPWQREGAAVRVRLGCGQLAIAWAPLPPRRIALLTLPMLRAQFAFEGVPAEARSAFMRRFDLHTHRGGG